MFFNVHSLLTLLKAFDASIKSAASVSSSSKLSRTAWTAASHPDSRPAQTCKLPHALWMSLRTARTAAFPTSRLRVSPMPIGRTSLPPFSNGIRRHARKVSREAGSTSERQSLFVKSAVAWHRPSAVLPKFFEQRRGLRSSLSRPDQPPAPFMLRARERIISPSIFSQVLSGTFWNSPGRMTE